MPTCNLGLDVHKVRAQYCLMDTTGQILGEVNVPTEAVAGLVPGADCAVVLEATGIWHAAYDALCATGAQVKLAHPSHVKAIASARVKTDKIDARILAHLLRADLVPEAWAPPPDVRELRDLVRLRWRFVSQRITAKNRMSNLLARRCLRYEGTDLFGRRGRAWLAAAARRSPSWLPRASCSSRPGLCSSEVRWSGQTGWERPFSSAEGSERRPSVTRLGLPLSHSPSSVPPPWGAQGSLAAPSLESRPPDGAGGGATMPLARRSTDEGARLTLTAVFFTWRRIELIHHGRNCRFKSARSDVVCRL